MYNTLSKTTCQAKIRESWGNFLKEKFNFDWYVTLTFKDNVGEWGADRNFRRFVRELRHRAGHRVEFLRTTEWQKQRNVPHYHLLMGNCSEIHRMEMVEWCKNNFGYSRILPYDRNLNASYYIGKYVTKENFDLLVSRGIKKLKASVL